MSKKFNRWLRAAAQAGIDVGDINQASATYTGQTPAPATPTMAPPPAPKQIKPPKQSISTQAGAGQSVRTSRKSKKRTRVSDLRIRRPRINTSLSIGAGGTGLNVGGY